MPRSIREVNDNFNMPKSNDNLVEKADTIFSLMIDSEQLQDQESKELVRNAARILIKAMKQELSLRK